MPTTSRIAQQMATQLGGGGSQTSTGADTLITYGMPCSEDNGGGWPNWQQTVRSMHPAGVYLSMADGSGHWCSDLINCTGGTITSPSVWDMLLASGDSKTPPSNWDQ